MLTVITNRPRIIRNAIRDVVGDAFEREDALVEQLEKALSERLITLKPVLELCGGVSDVTIHRWLRDQDFPQPIRIVGGRRLWREDEVVRWVNDRAAA